MKKILSRDITSYDLLKCFAVVTMIVDHTGYYFFPEDLWWRAVGRLSAPVWLFLVGYARSRDLSPRLWIGAGILIVSGLLGAPFFPLDILVSIIIVRLVLDKTGRFLLLKPSHMLTGMLALALATVPTYVVVDYGALALVLALCGWLVRGVDDTPGAPKTRARGFMLFAFMLYILTDQIFFGFTQAQFGFIAAGVAGVFLILYAFREKTYPRLTANLPGPAAALLRLGGRRTLEIYVGHLVLFRILACAFGLRGYGLLEWWWF